MKSNIQNKYVSATQNRKGVAAVEAAVVLPMMLILVLGTIEMGTALRASTIMQSSVREAGRITNMRWSEIVGEGDTPNAKLERDLRNFVTASGLPGNDLVVSIIHADGGSAGQAFDISDEANELKMVKIKLELPYSSISLFPVRYMGGKSVSASLVMRAGMAGGLSQ
ncbi:MAG: TadE family protein [Fuerstiella sp.]